MTQTTPIHSADDSAHDSAHSAGAESTSPRAARSVADVSELKRRVLRAARGEELVDALSVLRTKEQLEAFQASCGRLERGKLVVAVLGQQGIGKSSLVNAIVGRRVLPINEFETTNVPCRVLGVDAEGERAEVEFADGRVERGPASSAFIGQFSDEQHNPKNERAVRELRVFLDCALLEHGVELVDLPGVGSLTEHTEKATYEFLSQISVGIFVVSSSPTLRAGEARFLSAIYRYVRRFIFVQNPWSEDEPSDIADGLEDNRRKLEEIARRHGVSEIELLSVDVHTGLEGATNERPDLVESSGLAELRRSLGTQLAEGAAMTLLKTEAACLGGHAGAATRSAQVKLAHLQATSADAAQRHQQARADKEAELREIEQSWQTRKAEFSTEVAGLLEANGQRIRAGLAATREAVVPLIQARKLSGEAIGEALNERISLCLEQAADALQDDCAERVQGLLDTAEELAARAHFSAGPEPQGGRGFDTEGAESWESAGGWAAGLGKFGLGVFGAEAVFVTGAAWLAGEALTAGALVVPVVGAAIALVILGVGLWARSAARDKAVRKILAQVDKLLARVSEQAPQQIERAMRQHTQKLLREMSEALAAELEGQRELMRGISSDYELNEQERTAQAARMQRHGEVLGAFLETLGLVLGSAAQAPRDGAAAAGGAR